MSAEYCFIQTRRPTKDGSDPGSIEEGWYTVTDGVVRLCDRDGDPIRGEESTAKLKPGETAKEVAVRLLRGKFARKPARPFNRPLRYQKLGWL
jgi:hypothetical protein